jgi:rhodanese-related sulfurtransferase
MGFERWTIGSAELKSILNERPDSITLLDVREPEEFEEDRLPGCKLIPLGELMSRANAELDPDSEIVIYCAHGIRSMHAVMGLNSLGYENLRSLEGGLCAYRE